MMKQEEKDPHEKSYGQFWHSYHEAGYINLSVVEHQM